MTFNTSNPIGSTDARDRSDNSENLDLAVNSLSQTFVDRLGVTRDTLEGIYQKSAYYRAGTFDAGYTLTNNRQTLAYGNVEYSWSGAFPKVVPAGSTPSTAGGIGAGAWVDRTDLTLRGEISNLISYAKIAGDYESLDTFIADLNADNCVGFINRDYSVATPIQISQSVDIAGAINGKSDFTEITNNSGSAIVVAKSFSSEDENITNVTLSKLSVKSSAINSGADGFKFERNNVHSSLISAKATGFEKGLHLVGCIGFVVEKAELTGNAYGLYTETSSVPGLSNYDTTNSTVRDTSLVGNSIGAYIGPVSQGLNFFGGSIERNTVSGVDIATTPPAGGVLNFNGTWFESNPIAVRFIEKPITVRFDTCTFYANTELFSNNGSGTINAAFERCKIEGSHVDLNIFNGTFANNFCYSCTFTADSPAAYQQQNWTGTPVVVSDGNTLLSSRAIGNGRYAVEAIGAPSSTALSDGSTWNDVATGINYIRQASTWKRVFSSLSIDKTIDVPSLAVGGTYSYGPFTLSGVVAGSFIEVASSINMQGVSVTGVSTALNSVTINFYNNSEVVVDLASAVYRIKAST